MAKPFRPLAERFAERYEAVTETGCWLWTAGIFPNGYGAIQVEKFGNNRGAHRVSWLLNKGEIPQGQYVCHKCDTPACVNPDHLFLGTELQNVADKIAKGRARYAFGAGQGHTDLTEEQVVAIRNDPRPQVAIAADFGISQQRVSKIKRGEAWKYADGATEAKPHAKGEAHRGAKLTADKVVSIRRDERKPEDIAQDYGVSRALIRGIKLRKKWAHVA